MSWADFKTNVAAIGFIAQAIRLRRLGHAYLLAGEFSGKLEVARQISAALNCEKNDGDACGNCPSCRKIFEDRHPDVRIIKPESKSRQIPVEDVRELERACYLKALEARVKVGVLVDADRLTLAAQDAFLKTLEEPPKNTLFLLLSSEPQQLKYTILSRCLRLNLFQDEEGEPGRREREIREVLAQWGSAGPQESALLRAYRLADLFQALLNDARSEIEARVEESYAGKGYETLQAEQAEKVQKEKEALIEAEYRKERSRLTRVLQHHFRDRAVAEPGDRKAVRAFETLETMNQRWNRNMNEGLVLEIAMMHLAERLSR